MTNSISSDQDYLANDQYRDASNLNARVILHQRFSENPQGWFPWVFDTLEKLPAQARVLELGCGQGNLWSACPERIPAGWSITLSDFSTGMLQAAWRNLVVIGRGFKFEQFDTQAIPYADETFEIVIANHMLYHVPDRPRALAEIRRVLKPGGLLVAATNGKNHLKEMTAWFKRLGFEKDFSASFTLKNGLHQIKPFFSRVETRRYLDNLHIREVQPLLDYLRSSIPIQEVPPDAFDELRHELEHELEQQGEIFVSKDSGLFLATK